MDNENKTNAMTEIFGDVIYAYTREQAIADGVLADLTKIAPDVCRQHYKYHIACTETVWNIIQMAVENEKHCNDYKGVIHDMLWMSRMMKRDISPTTIMFKVIITGAGGKDEKEFKMVCGLADDASPCLTIMLLDED